MATRTVTATKAKNEFGRLLDTAMQGTAVVITKHDAPRAVLLSMEAFTALTRPRAPEQQKIPAVQYAKIVDPEGQ